MDTNENAVNNAQDNEEFDRLAEALESPKAVDWTPPKPKEMIKVRPAMMRTRQVAFLKAFSELGTISLACKAAGINQQTELKWRKSADVWYQQQFKDALQSYRDQIENEVHNRAINGVEVPIIGKVQTPLGPEDVIIGHKTVKSDLLLMFHAKRHVPEYRDKYEAPKENDKVVESVSPLTRITLQLDIMQERRKESTTIIDITPERPALPETTEDGTR